MSNSLPTITDQEVADLIAEICDYSPYGGEPMADSRYKLECAFARLEREVCDLKRAREAAVKVVRDYRHPNMALFTVQEGIAHALAQGGDATGPRP